MNIVETNEKTESLTEKCKVSPKKQKISGQIKWKIQKIQYGNKKLSDGLNSRMERTKEIVSELENRAIEMIHSEQQKGNRLKKKKKKP